MALRYSPGESYESWLIRIQSHELRLAQQKLAKGLPNDQVMEELSQNLIKKVLHPILVEFSKPSGNYNMEESQSRYQKIMENVKLPADHVDPNS
jgi:glutamyl-tRNA reductase